MKTVAIINQTGLAAADAILTATGKEYRLKEGLKALAGQLVKSDFDAWFADFRAEED